MTKKGGGFIARRGIRRTWAVRMLCVGFCVALGATAQAANTFMIGNVTAERGETVLVPVTLSATADCTAALLRLRFNADVLENPSATAGPLLSPDHTLDTFSPSNWRVNACVYSASGAPEFEAQSGVLLYLSFRVKADAPLGKSNIRLTTTGTPALPASNLIDASGAALAHTVTVGSVTVEQTLGAQGEWMLYE